MSKGGAICVQGMWATLAGERGGAMRNTERRVGTTLKER